MTEIRRRGAVTPRPRLFVLLDPLGAFASVARRPLWGLSVMVVLACAVLPPLAIFSRVEPAAIVETELKRSGRLAQLPVDKRAEIIELGGRSTRVLLPLGAVAKRSLWMTLLSLLLLGLLKGARPELRLSPVAGAVGLAMAPLCVHDLLSTATWLTRDAASMAGADLWNGVLSNPAAWFHVDTRHTLSGPLLAGIDFFELWSCALVAIGVNAVAGTRSLIPWLVPFGGHFALVVTASAMAAGAAGRG